MNLSSTNFADPITHTNVTEYNHVGGNLNLKPENADSTTVGIVYTPTDGWFAVAYIFGTAYAGAAGIVGVALGVLTNRKRAHK